MEQVGKWTAFSRSQLSLVNEPQPSDTTCCRMAVTRYASQNILCRIHATNKHAFLSIIWMRTSSFGHQQVKKMWQITSLPFPIGIIGCFWLLTGRLGILWGFLLPMMVHTAYNTCKPQDFKFSLPQYYVNCMLKERWFGVKGHPCQCRKLFRLPRTLHYTRHLNFTHLFNFICFFTTGDVGVGKMSRC